MNPEYLNFLGRDRQRALLDEAQHLHLLHRIPARAGLRAWIAHRLRGWADFLEPRLTQPLEDAQPC